MDKGHRGLITAVGGTVAGHAAFSAIASVFIDVRTTPKLAIGYAFIVSPLFLFAWFYFPMAAALMAILSIPVLWAAVPLTTTIGGIVGLIVLLTLKNYAHLFWATVSFFALLEVLMTRSGAKGKFAHLAFLLSAFLPIELTWIYSAAEAIPATLYCKFHSQDECRSFEDDVARLNRRRVEQLTATSISNKSERYAQLSEEQKDLYRTCEFSSSNDKNKQHPEACDSLFQQLQTQCGESCAQQMILDQCQDGNILGCFRASSFSNNEMVFKSLRRECFFNQTASSYEKTDHFNFPLACDALLVMSQRLGGQEQQANTALYAKTGCDQGTPYSCYIYGSALLAANDIRGLDAIKISCDGGMISACQYLEKKGFSKGTANNARSE